MPRRDRAVRDSTRIGFREPWLRLVREKGYQIVGHEFIPIANDETTVVPSDVTTNGSSVARHLTALFGTDLGPSAGACAIWPD